MNQKQMLFKFLEEQKEPRTLDEIMQFVDSNKEIPRSTIRARLSEMRKKGIKIDNKIRQIEKNGEGWIIKNAKV